MLKRLIPALVCSAALVSPALANMKGGFFIPQLPVNQISSTEFEVLEGPSEGARTYWCAAAFHAQFELGASDGRLYLTRGFGPARSTSGTRGVSFSLQEPAGAAESVSLSIRDEGSTLLVGHAIQFCRDSDLEADR